MLKAGRTSATSGCHTDTGLTIDTRHGFSIIPGHHGRCLIVFTSLLVQLVIDISLKSLAFFHCPNNIAANHFFISLFLSILGHLSNQLFVFFLLSGKHNLFRCRWQNLLLL